MGKCFMCCFCITFWGIFIAWLLAMIVALADRPLLPSLTPQPVSLSNLMVLETDTTSGSVLVNAARVEVSMDARNKKKHKLKVQATLVEVSFMGLTLGRGVLPPIVVPDKETGKAAASIAIENAILTGDPGRSFSSSYSSGQLSLATTFTVRGTQKYAYFSSATYYGTVSCNQLINATTLASSTPACRGKVRWDFPEYQSY